MVEAAVAAEEVAAEELEILGTQIIMPLLTMATITMAIIIIAASSFVCFICLSKSFLNFARLYDK